MKYSPNEIEAKWQKYWAQHQTFAASNHSSKPKYYVLDMFPYPSGAGLHVGHPLGYIASDVYSRFKRHKGFNVLHPMGYDSFGLPAEQYAIQTGQRPEDTTSVNIDGGFDKEGRKIDGYRKQLDKIGFSFDWSREVRTSDPSYYKFTQWIFIQLFDSWYCKNSGKAFDISELVKVFESEGNATVEAVCDDAVAVFSADEWNGFSSEEQQQILLRYRLTYLAETEVNWCPALGTVLANDEIVNGVSERGGHPVIRRKMTQWSMRISAYAERLLEGLDTIDWSESIKESQRNWIGKSVGAVVDFKILTPNPSPTERGTAPYLTGNPLHAKTLLSHAKTMRKEPTQSESILWEALRNRKLSDKFRRQHLIGDYIADFACLNKKLVIEVDGGYHDGMDQIALDELRTLELEQKHSFKVIRFTNDEIEHDLGNVLEKIKEELFKRKSISIPLSSGEGLGVRIFTTRPDTIFGVTFMTLAPEHELVSLITTPGQKAAVDAYVEKTAKRSERERMSDVKTISGVFTGAYAEHPFTKEPIPVWIGDYVLAGYGTGAVMAVPCGDERDYAFAKHFDIPITNIFADVDISEEAFSSKDNIRIANSDFLNGLNYKEATKKIIQELEKTGHGKGKTNYRLRDAVFSRQRYWGEPFPVYYVNGLPQMIDAQYLPIVLPEVEKYLPTEDGQPPLGNATDWAWNSLTHQVVSNNLIDHQVVFPLELNTMPGWAGSSWYWMRYMDALNTEEFAGKEALHYWQNVDLYIGGSEHATGHLLYARFWNKFLKDKGFAPTEEPFKKLINQGMILGMSAFAYRLVKSNVFVSKNIFRKLHDSNNGEEFILKLKRENTYSKEDKTIFDYNNLMLSQQIHVDVAFVNSSDELNIEAFRNSKIEYKNSNFISENGNVILNNDEKYIVGREVEKMSKSKYNVVTPDDICAEYGADTLRLYEMFLGPLEQAKPWNTAGITGVFGFLKKLWRLYFDEKGLIVTDNEPSKDSLKTLHKTIKKVQEDIEGFSFNTSVSQFMICVNELSAQSCHERGILEPLAILISPYAPHVAEELWLQLGNAESISTVAFPVFYEKHLIESNKEYPVSFNGKMRFTLELPLDLTAAQIEQIVMKDDRTARQLEGRTPNKVIIVPGKIINIVG